MRVCVCVYSREGKMVDVELNCYRDAKIGAADNYTPTRIRISFLELFTIFTNDPAF